MHTTFYRILLIGLGGCVGAIARYLISITLNQDTFPWGTLSVNVLGAILIGGLSHFLMMKTNLPASLQLFCITGFLGAFTTFSTFSWEAISLFQKGEWFFGTAYIMSSILLGLAGCILGIKLVSKVIG